MRSNGPSIRAIRERSGLTKTQLAHRTGIDRTLISRIESGERNGTPAQLIAIAQGLHVDLLAVLAPAARIDPDDAVA